ncbi:MAG: hypothetical protein OQK04_06715, partial [Kangiellaceae bacterium]|nr:hypothetical protein [Kangiellaceae bacterium]
TVNASLLYFNLKKEGIFSPDKQWKSWFYKLFFANSLLIAFIFLVMAPVEAWQDWDLFTRVWNLLILVFGSVGIYAFALVVAGVRMKDLRHA